MNSIDAFQYQSLEHEIAHLKERINELRLGRRVLLNLLVLLEHKHQTELKNLKDTIDLLQKRNFQLMQRRMQ